MTRHYLDAIDAAHTVVVGWDNPLNTFFAQVLNNELDADDPAADVLFVGWRDGEIQSLSDLKAQVAPYAEIPLEIVTQLEQDKAAYAHWQETPLQANMKKLRQKIEADLANQSP